MNILSFLAEEEDDDKQMKIPVCKLRRESPRCVDVKLKPFQFDKVLQLSDDCALYKLKLNVIMNLLSNELLTEDELNMNKNDTRIDIITKPNTISSKKSKKEIYNAIQNLPLFLSATSYSFIIHGSGLDIHLGMDIYLRIVDAQCIKVKEHHPTIWSCVFDAFDQLPLSSAVNCGIDSDDDNNDID